LPSSHFPSQVFPYFLAPPSFLPSFSMMEKLHNETSIILLFSEQFKAH
jgi:hypothetical protein